jgi:glycosyltransferase involved in cell wall biosynthesis
VPNFNHEAYLRERLDSIFSQTYRDMEVILLDDFSSDDSLVILEEYARRADVRLVRNSTNSGSPFVQWLKGMAMAQADVLWIAESDDTCSPDLLRTLLPAFADKQVKLAYANSYVIDSDDRVVGDYTSTDYLTSLSTTKWSFDYKVNAETEINDGLGVKNTILNISAVLMRRFEIEPEFAETLQNMHIAGDWYFIVRAIQGGTVRYISKKLNSHRRHAASVIAQTVSDGRIRDFFAEFAIVQKFIVAHYPLSGVFAQKWEAYLRSQWSDFTNGRAFEYISAYFPFDDLKRMILAKIHPDP